MNKLLLNILLTLSWVSLTGDISFFNVVEGFIISYVILLISRNLLSVSGYIKKTYYIINFVLFFIWELVLANLKVTLDIVTPQHLMKPGIIALPLSAKSDFEIFLLSLVITLTPGTLALDVSEDNSTLFVHVMYMEKGREHIIEEIKENFENKIIKILR